MQVHLDPIGGIAGDMFIAAILDAFPELEPGLHQSVRAVGLPDDPVCHLFRHQDDALRGARLVVEDGHGHPHHHHVTWAEIRALLSTSALSPPVKRHATGIFTLLAEAEASVHGVTEDAVTFHEVGATDSIVDIVGAAHLIAEIGAERWSVAALPLGSGRVSTAHGLLPIPAPATARLLQGFITHDDGIPGERVTPTGAAILRYLGCASGGGREPRILARSGTGFGTKIMPGISNCLRVLVFEEPSARADHRELAVLEFEVDDQPAEDLATGLDRLRGQATVYDVVQMPVFGKKGRMMTHVRVLASPGQLDRTIAACFRETTTIGLRHRLVEGAALHRRTETVEIDGKSVRVKVVDRPGIGRTAKAESDDLAGIDGGHAVRVRVRVAAERQVLEAPRKVAE